MKDIYKTVTDKIIAELEQGVAPWVKPWTTVEDPIPRNGLTQRPYRGINTLVLGMEQLAHGYSSNQWLTFRQALQAGGHVRKGEKSSTIVYYEPRVVGTDTDESESETSTRVIPLLKVFNVFNLDQIAQLPDSFGQQPSEAAFDSSALADQVLEHSGAVIHHQGFKAMYVPSKDAIYLPLPQHFADAAGYYSTALHELTHWTGHPSRLKRSLAGRFGDAAYAAEELIAELGSSFLCAHCRIDGQLQHASYIDAWLNVLQRDARAIFTAAAQAQKAADYLLDRADRSEQAVQQHAHAA